MRQKQQNSTRVVRHFVSVLLLLLVTCALLADASVAQPEGYRMEDYDAPVPDGLDGATRVTAMFQMVWMVRHALQQSM